MLQLVIRQMLAAANIGKSCRSTHYQALTWRIAPVDAKDSVVDAADVTLLATAGPGDNLQIPSEMEDDQRGRKSECHLRWWAWR